MGRRFWFASALVTASAVVLPCIGTWSRRQQLPRCAVDGVAIVPIYAVEIVGANERNYRFCCIRCAEYWLTRNPSSAAAIHVTDEVSGKTIDAAEAFFVRSRVQTNAVTENRIHAFANLSDAEIHAGQFRGRLLTNHEHPFQGTGVNAGLSRTSL
jgi:hypothetical protein